MFEFVDDMVDDIVKEYRDKIRKAVKKAESVAKQKIENEIIPTATDKYYEAYLEPKYYDRTYQLKNSFGPYTKVKESGNVFSLKLGIEDENPFGPMVMSHRGKTADENIIFSNFKAGIHPNVPTLHDELQGTNTVQYINNLLDELIENELMPLIDSATD